MTTSTPFRARLGQRPIFPTQAAANAYDAGYAAFPSSPIAAIGSPAAQGYLDAKREQLAQAEVSDRHCESATAQRPTDRTAA